MKPGKIPPFFYFLIGFFSFVSPAQALHVKRIQPQTGILILDDSRQVKLAGLHLAPEAFKSMAILFSNQEIELEEEKELSTPDFPAVYATVKTLQIPFPNKSNTAPEGSKVLLNEMLISSGLASVDETKAFKKKDAFLKLQGEARRLGKGLWSEEPSVKKK